jgi:transposase
LLADRDYSTYAILAILSCKDVAFVSQNHAQKKVDFQKDDKPKTKDHLAKWKKPKRKPVWMSKEDYSLRLDRLTVREFAVSGIVYVTTLLDAKAYPKRELVKFYKERWKIELDFRTLKSDLKMEMLRCKTP